MAQKSWLIVSAGVRIDLDEVELSAIRAQGAGGQNVNKVSNAVHLRFDSQASSLPESCKARLLVCADARVTAAGVVIIKAQRHRSLETNREDALERLVELVRDACEEDKPRRPTRPTLGAKKRRLEAKGKRAVIKAGRRPVDF